MKRLSAPEAGGELPTNEFGVEAGRPDGTVVVPTPPGSPALLVYSTPTDGFPQCAPVRARYLQAMRSIRKKTPYLAVLRFAGMTSTDDSSSPLDGAIRVKWYAAEHYDSAPDKVFSPLLPCVVEIDSEHGDTIRFSDISLHRALRILNDPHGSDEPLLNENELSLASALADRLEQVKVDGLKPQLVMSRSRRKSLRAEGATRELNSPGSDAGIDAGWRRVVEQTTISVNDFHGRLTPSDREQQTSGEKSGRGTPTWPSGGIEYLASMVHEQKRKHPNVIVGVPGDEVGSSQRLSALDHDRPTIKALNGLVDIGAPGNHNLEKGVDEFFWLLRGGPHPDRPWDTDDFAGAQFPYVVANLRDMASGKPLLHPYAIFELEGVKIAYIGAVTKKLPSLVTPDHLVGLEVTDEAQAINQYLPELEAAGVRTVIVLLHEGAHPGDIAELQASGKLVGPLGKIHEALAPSVRDVLCGHTHELHMLMVDGRIFAQAGAFGRYAIQLTRILDQRSGTTVFRFAKSIAIDRSRFDPDPRQTAIISETQRRLAPVLSRPLEGVRLRFALPWQNKAHIEAAIMQGEPVSGETLLGNVLADALCEATGADMAFVNLGAIREGLPAGTLTYGDIVDVLPNRGGVVSMDLTGEQIVRLIEDQWRGRATPKILQISDGLSYRWDPSARGLWIRDSVKLHGQALNLDGIYRVATTEHLGKGAAEHRVFLEGTRRVLGMLDIEALERHLPKLSKRSRPSLGRIARVNLSERWPNESLALLQAAHKLELDEHNRIFRSTMSLLLDSTAQAVQPLAIVLGGQPGSGKSTLARKLAPRFPADERFIMVDSDLMRALHPDYPNLLSNHGGQAADIVHPDAAQWADDLTEASLHAQRNLLIDGAAWDANKLSKLVDRLRNAGCRVEFHVAAVPLAVSRARVKHRFREQTARSGFGRLISGHYHVQAFEGLATTVAELERLRSVDAIYLYDSEQNEVYSNAIDNGEWQDAPRAPEMLSRYRGGH